jgi:hypothetical protein
LLINYIACAQVSVMYQDLKLALALVYASVSQRGGFGRDCYPQSVLECSWYVTCSEYLERDPQL